MRWSIFAVGLAAVLAGCGGSEQSSSIVRTGRPQAEKLPSGKLDADPGPLTIAQVDAQPDGSPQAAVIELLFWAQWGGFPNVVDRYERETVAAVGGQALRQAYELVRSQLLNSRPEVAFTCRGGQLTLVAVWLLSRYYSPQPISFLLHRQGRRWRIVLDTILAHGPEGAGFAAAVASELAKRSLTIGAFPRTSRLPNRPSEMCLGEGPEFTR